MQKNQSFRMRIFFLFSSVLLIFVLGSVSSCKDGDKKGSEKTAAAPVEFKMNCVILTKAQVQAWVDSGWTNPANPNRVKNLLLQFYTANASGAGNNMQLIAYPGKSLTNVQPGGKSILAIDTTCTPKTLTGATAFANNSISLDDLKILKPDGSLDNFDFVRFKPNQRYAPYISFDIEIVRLGILETLGGNGTWPCPPYCSIDAP